MRSGGHPGGVSENQAPQQQEPAESGGLEPEGEGGGQVPAQPHESPAESGALQEQQQGKGYGRDEGEREQTLPNE
jgi:hypothetical protein